MKISTEISFLSDTISGSIISGTHIQVSQALQ